MDFKKGDVVELKSGGPQMTILNETYDHQLHCGCFAGAKIRKRKLPSRGPRRSQGKIKKEMTQKVTANSIAEWMLAETQQALVRLGA
jgi:uncharacterized protein YodC (DUF2158 family)